MDAGTAYLELVKVVLLGQAACPEAVPSLDLLAAQSVKQGGQEPLQKETRGPGRKVANNKPTGVHLFSRHAKDEKIFRSCTAFTLEEFEALHALLQPGLQEPYGAARRKRKRALSTRDMLFGYLKMMRSQHSSWETFAYEFGYSSKESAANLWKHVTGVVLDKLDYLVQWPSKEERRVLSDLSALSGLPGLIGYIDGTRLRLRRPTFGQHIVYSGKIKGHCTNNQIICDILGRIIDCSVNFNGSAHDKVLWDVSPQRSETCYFSNGEYLLGDPGYIGTDSEHMKAMTKAGAGHTLAEARVRDVETAHRLLVEKCIGSVKITFPFAGLLNKAVWTKEKDKLGTVTLTLFQV